MFGIVSTAALIGIPAVLLLALLLGSRQGVRSAVCEKLGITPDGNPLRVATLASIPALLMVLALLRPYSGVTEFTVPTSTRDYMFIVDVSRSMLARDVPPSRYQLAKRKMKDIIAEFTNKGIAHRYGIVLFAGYSYLLCPLTDDIGVVKQFIDEVSPAMVTSLGSNLEAGITTALSRFNETNAQNARLVLVSDGEDDILSVNKVVELLKEKKIRLDALGVGTVTGSPIPLDNGALLKDVTGNIVHSRLNEESLKRLADATNGTYARVTLDDADIHKLTQEQLVPSMPSDAGTRTIKTYQEFGSWLALLALLAILASVGASSLRHLVRVALIVMLPVSVAHATPVPQGAAGSVSAHEAFQLYEKGDYTSAEQAFERLTQSDPTNRELLQAYASSLYKVGKFKESQALFHKLTEDTENGREYFENTYNEGNAFLSLSRYQDAIDAYTKALDVKPDDERALHNRELAKKLLQEEKNRPTPTPTPTPSAQPSQSPESSPSPNPSPESDGTKAASPSPSDSSAPTQSPDASPSGAPTPNPDASPSEDSAPTPNPSAEPSPTKEAQNTRLKESQPEETPQGTPPPSNPTPHNTAAAEPQSVQEAQAWLESLPESPLLVRRERGRAKPGGQTW